MNQIALLICQQTKTKRTRAQKKRLQIKVATLLQIFKFFRSPKKNQGKQIFVKMEVDKNDEQTVNRKRKVTKGRAIMLIL